MEDQNNIQSNVGVLNPSSAVLSSTDGNDRNLNRALFLKVYVVLGVVMCFIPLILFVAPPVILKVFPPTLKLDAIGVAGPLLSIILLMGAVPTLFVTGLISNFFIKRRKFITLDIIVMCSSVLFLILNTAIEMVFRELFGDIQISAVIILLSSIIIVIYNILFVTINKSQPEIIIPETIMHGKSWWSWKRKYFFHFIFIVILLSLAFFCS
jgi:hypothetical protein